MTDDRLLTDPAALLAAVERTLSAARRDFPGVARPLTADAWADRLAAALTGVPRARRALVGPNVGRLWDAWRAEARSRLGVVVSFADLGERGAALHAARGLCDAAAGVRLAEAA